jgi:hypothetical protein
MTSPGDRRITIDLDGEPNSGERIDPTEAREADEVVVARAQLGAVLDRERCQVGVADQLSAGAEWLKEIAQVARRWPGWC